MLTTHTHQLAKTSRLLPSSLCVLFSPTAPRTALGTGQGTLRDRRILRTVLTDSAPPLFSCLEYIVGEPSTCWRVALCISRFRSQACPLEAPGTNPGLSPFQSFLPSFVRTFSCLKPEQRARSELFSLCFSFLLVVPLLMSCRIFELSRVTFQIKSYTLFG